MEHLTPENVNTAFWITMGVGAVVGLASLKIMPIVMVIVSLVTLHYATRKTVKSPSPPTFTLAPPASTKAATTPYSHTLPTDIAQDAIRRSNKVHQKEDPSSRTKLYKLIHSKY
jgi:hypothetical protein